MFKCGSVCYYQLKVLAPRSAVIPIAQHLPKAYLRPVSSDLPKTEPLSTPLPQRNTETDRVIEAEWRPISGAPARSANVSRANSADLTAEEPLLVENQSASLVAECYQQMTPQQRMQRGAILDIMV